MRIALLGLTRYQSGFRLPISLPADSAGLRVVWRARDFLPRESSRRLGTLVRAAAVLQTRPDPQRRFRSGPDTAGYRSATAGLSQHASNAMTSRLASGAQPVSALQHASPPPPDWRRVQRMPPNQALNLRGLHRIVRAVVRAGARAFPFAFGERTVLSSTLVEPNAIDCADTPPMFEERQIAWERKSVRLVIRRG